MKQWCALYAFLYSYGIDEVTATNLAIHLHSLKAVMSDVNMDYTLDMRRDILLGEVSVQARPRLLGHNTAIV